MAAMLAVCAAMLLLATGNAIKSKPATASHTVPQEVQEAPSWSECRTKFDCLQQLVHVQRVMGCATGTAYARARRGGIKPEWVPIRDRELACQELLEESQHSVRAAEIRARNEERERDIQTAESHRRRCESGEMMRGCGG